MKKAFTLSEALVTLAIIGVLAAILIPALNNIRPDKDKIAYKKALYNMQGAVSNAMDSTVYSIAANSAAYWKDQNIADDTFCLAIADALNTAGAVNCDGAPGSSSYENPNFITTDGIRYWGLEGKFTGDTRTIRVDRQLSDGELRNIAAQRGADGANGLKIEVSYDGKIGTPKDDADNSFAYEDELIESSFDVSKVDRKN